jgi:signal transduction histidine kinase/HAMP domain-containing protein
MTQFLSGLRFRLIALVLMAVVPAFGVILYSAPRHRDLTAKQVQRNALGAARAIAAEQERYLDNAHQFLIMLAQIPQIRDNNPAACSKILAGLLEPLYADLIVTDKKGQPICTALLPGTSLAKPNAQELRRVIETHDFFVGKIRTLPAKNRTVVALGYPVLESPAVLRAIVVTALDLSWVTKITAENHLYPGATFTLVDGQGKVLLRYPQNGDWTGKSIFAKAASESGMPRDTEKTFESVGADGFPRLFAFSELKSRPGGESVYAVIDIPADLAFAEADRILLQNLMTLGILSALTLLAAWFGADLFVLRRTRDLVTATEQLAAGNLGARTQLPYGASELGQMARAFDDLVENLEKREAEARISGEQVQQQRQQQKALYDLNVAITSTLEVTAVLNTLLDELSALFPACGATLSWIDEKSGALEVVAQRNIEDSEPVQMNLATELGLPLVVLKQGSPLAIANAQIDPRTTNPEFLRRHRLFSYLGLPLIAKGEALGVLSFYTKEEREFNPEEINFLTSLVNQAAIAIFNSRLYERTRNQALELEKSNKTKDEFLGVMSHELRTPLNIVMNYAEALTMGTFGKISGDQSRATEKIRSQAEHLLTLINGILEITKIESGTPTVVTESLDLTEFLSEQQSDYAMQMEKALAIRWDYSSEFPMIVSDRMKLKQILTNLINNAIKFTDQGSVTISARMLDQDQMLELAVADTGIGIPEELLPFVFDKFRQMDSTTTRNHPGAGLGLYIVKTFVELLQGTIRVQSTVGDGSTFIVRLPIKTESIAPRRPGIRRLPVEAP